MPTALQSPRSVVRGRPASPTIGQFDGFLDTARKRWRLAADAEADKRREGLADYLFYKGEQWPEAIRRQRELDGRPCLVLPRLKQSLNQLVNQRRQSRPGIKVSPVGNGAGPEVAAIIQGLVRHIEVRSNSDIAQDTAFLHAAIVGFGYYRLRTQYAFEDRGFAQEIIIDPIDDPFTVYLDPTFRNPDASDIDWAFIMSDLTPEQFQEQHPNAEYATLEEFRGIGDVEREWCRDGKIRVAEYYWISRKRRELLQLIDGTEVHADELMALVTQRVTALEPRPEVAVRDGAPVSRPTYKPIVNWAKITGRETLKKEIIPGRGIPIMRVAAREIIVDGRRVLEGLVRDLKDACQELNFHRSGIAEAIALMPKSPIQATVQQMEGFEHMYDTANTKNWSTIPYNAQSEDGNLVPAPHRQVIEPAVQAMLMAAHEADHDIKAGSGYYGPSLGDTPSDSSGISIRERKSQGDTANFDFGDNANRTYRLCGQRIVDMIPDVIDTAQAIQILHPDETMEEILVNQRFEEDGKVKLFDLTVGRYDVTLATGASLPTRRTEAVKGMVELVTANPALMNVIGDLLVRNLDWPGADEIADRLRKMLPPELQDSNAKGDVPPAMQAKYIAMAKQIEQLTAELNRTSDLLNQKQIESQARREELKSREFIEEMKLQVAMALKQAELSSTQGIELLRQQIQVINKRLDISAAAEAAAAEAQNTPAAPPAAPAGPPVPQAQPQQPAMQPPLPSGPPAAPAQY